MENKGNILIVDDTTETLSLLTKLLTEEGYTTFPADSGELALASLKKRIPDLILLDVRMPGIDGFEACRRIKSHDELANVPVIFLTVETDLDEKIEGFRLGAVDYIVKPFEKGELLMRVKTSIDMFKMHKKLRQQSKDIKAYNDQLSDFNRVLEEKVRQRTNELKDKNEELTVVYEECKRIRENAQKNERQFRAIFENSLDAIRLSKNGIIVLINQAYLKLFGFDNENEVIGKSVFDQVSPSEIPRLNEYAKKRAEGEYVPDFYESKGLRKNREEFQLEVKIGSYHIDNEKFSVAIIRDITQRKLFEKELITSEERYKRITEGITDYLYTVKVEDGKAIETIHNEASIAVTGYSAYEFAKDPNLWINMVYPDDKDLVSGMFLKILISEDLQPFEHRIINKSGNIRWISNTLIPKFDSYGNLVSYDGVIKDITDRKQAEQLIKNSEEKFRALTDSASFGIYLTDLIGKCIYVNEIWCEMAHLSFEQALDDGWVNGIYEEDRHKVFENWQKMIESNGVWGFEYRFGTKDKTTWVFGTAKNYKNDLGEIVGYVGTNVNITERKFAEEELKKSKLLLESSLESQQDTILLSIDKDFKYLYFNKFHKEVMKLSYNTDIELGMNALECITNYDDRLAAEDNYLRALKGESHTNIRMYGGVNHAWYESFFNPIINAKNEIIGATVLARNVSNRINSEEIIKQQNQELIKLNANKDRFVSILAHDLKSPFSSLLGFINLLIKNIGVYDSDKIETQLNILKDTASSTNNLLDDILLWARSQTGKLAFEPQKLIFQEVCENIVESLKIVASSKKIAIQIFAVDIIEFVADPNMFKTILRNLISNAIKFTPFGGKIDIYAQNGKNEIIFTVSDSGVGIGAEEKEQLFDITKTHTTKGTAGEKGTGLGLHLCKEFIEKHKGKIWVESELGKGSEFIFALPG